MKMDRRVLRRLGLAAALLVLFTITGFLVLPVVVKSQLERRLSAQLGRQVTVDKVSVNPYALTLTLENFRIRELDGTSVFLGWRRLYVNFEGLSSLRREWVIGDVVLTGFDARVNINPDQSFNFSDILAKFAAADPTTPARAGKPPRPIRIARLQVADARIDVTDESRPQRFATVVGPLMFALREFRTVSERGAPYEFQAITEAGERLAWTGTLQTDPLRSQGELAIENLVLPKYAPYYADQVRAELAAGTLSLRGRYTLSLGQERILKLLDGSVQLLDFKLLERGSQVPAVDVHELTMNGIEADAFPPMAKVASVVVNGGDIRARREKDGTISLLTMLQPPRAAAVASAPHTVTQTTSSAPTTGSSAGSKAPDAKVAEIAVKDFNIEFADHAVPQSARLALHNFEASLKHFSLSGGTAMPLHVAFDWRPEGTIRVDGDVSFKPLKATLQTEMNRVSLLPLFPYAEQFADVRMTRGTFSAALNLQVELAGEKPLAAALSGDVTLDNFGVIERAKSEELAGFSQLGLRGIHFTTSPTPAVAIGELNVVAPYGRIVVNPDKSLNFETVLAKRPEPSGGEMPRTATPAMRPPEGAAERAATPVRPALEIGKVSVSEGDYRFTDRSLEPNVTMAINHFGGTIAGLSSNKPAQADVALNAMVDGVGPIAIKGKLDPLGPTKSVDLKIDFKNIDLLPLSPYSGKYAGYELARGKLLLDVDLRIEGAKIDAANVVTLSQFTFGNAVKSPDATNLPVRLGVALLKDLHGKIVIDVPVQGSTDDPSFRIGRVVLRVIVNLLTKAAASPFSLLGAAFGGGGDELAFQEFAPGGAELQTSEIKKLETMTKALANRPGLSVALEGSFDTAADTYALKRKKLEAQVRRAIWESRRQRDTNIPPPEKLEFSPEERAETVKKLYDQQFPPGTEFGTPVPPPPDVISAPAPPAGLFRRIGYALTMRARRDQRAVQEENARRIAQHEQAAADAAAVGRPFDEMLGRLAETIAVDENDLRQLAQARAEKVRDYFANDGKISVERLFLSKEKSETGTAQTSPAGKGARVFLHLQ